MKKQCMRRFITYLVTILILLISYSSGSAQDDNLLSNPGFENGFRIVDNNAKQEIANNWQPWTAPRTSDMPTFQNVPPVYFPSTKASGLGGIPRIRSGSDSQVYFSFFETHDAGIFQQVSDITPGTELRFSIFAYVLSTQQNDLNISEFPGGVAVRVGVDPTGGTDPLASTVQYSEAAIFYDAFRQYSTIVEAQSDTVTVFIRSTISDPVQFTYIYLDDAVLEITPDSQPPDEPDEAPTTTNTPTSTSTPTPTPTPTQTPTATNTDSGDDTPTPDDDDSIPTPTQENNGDLSTATPIGGPTTDPLFSTATAIVDEATQTAAASEDPVFEDFPGTVTHTVRRGDTVGNLATLYGSSISAILRANDLDNSAFIREGQELTVPVRLVAATDTPDPSAPPLFSTVTPTFGSGGPTSGSLYIVQPGDSLFSIANLFNTTVTALVQLNGIANPNRIFPNQQLRIPFGTGGPIATATPTATAIIPPPNPPPPVQPQSYIVQRGDTLYSIALRFGKSIVQLGEINNVTNFNRIFTGQVLILP